MPINPSRFWCYITNCDNYQDLTCPNCLAEVCLEHGKTLAERLQEENNPSLTDFCKLWSAKKTRLICDECWRHLLSFLGYSKYLTLPFPYTHSCTNICWQETLETRLADFPHMFTVTFCEKMGFTGQEMVCDEEWRVSIAFLRTYLSFE